MADCQVLDGKALAAEIRSKIAVEIIELKKKYAGFQPQLSIIQVGDLEDSSVYIRMKSKAAAEVGIAVKHLKLSRQVSEGEVVALVQHLNSDPKVHAILLQLPLDSENPIDADKCTNTIAVYKDVDGLTDVNAGRLARGNIDNCIVPCTPLGCLELIKRTGVSMTGKRVVVIGRSKIVGTPVSDLLRYYNTTVTVCHSKTENIVEQVSEADIVIVAARQPGMVKKDWIKPGAIVIDVGINSIPDASRKSGYRLSGDVDYASVAKVAGWLTPVPGGVGPMTVAMLMSNTLRCARKQLEVVGQWSISYLPLRVQDPVPSDITIARSQMPKKIMDLANEIGLLPSEIEPYGLFKAKVSLSVLERLKDHPSGKYAC